MTKKQIELMKNGKGFIAAMDQSGGSTPGALEDYGISESEYDTEAEMFDLVHAMRTRVITSPSFSSEYILGAILFKHTMNNKMKGKYTADYLWEEKGILPILKVDQGTENKENGVQLMKPMTKLDDLLAEAEKHNIFGTKMRSIIHSANPEGIKDIVSQQFEYGKKIYDAGFIPILEPEVNINSKDKLESEIILKEEILKLLKNLNNEQYIFKLSLPSQADFYQEIIEHPNVVRVVALSGGYSQEVAVNKLSENHNMIASFSRALLQNLTVDQSEKDFDKELKDAVVKIYNASVT
ncbi:fructose-bisphosphate aldolase [Halanaerobium saccharolyticum]|uniref:fructose-bisphosphate aldolase n=1 Tax=Halanaerobium saccharolyticum TaxID=43595 RepID=A0A4R7YKF1_9FIRM|nr:fructose bisphosphate aldolase [Halanaerobium saccharolyticum]RAK04155.1 fructose-bisphosphate aldolase [Halanaerobium saccharolyticum]TDV97950.1 fructose-bisphosphate aldolase [Halanaerobium saccharolyticum]TDX51011.1 fructose-bisphosphate aldolase [Halanaerobium saccharolyticum]